MYNAEEYVSVELENGWVLTCQYKDLKMSEDGATVRGMKLKNAEIAHMAIGNDSYTRAVDK